MKTGKVETRGKGRREGRLRVGRGRGSEEDEGLINDLGL